MNYFIKDPVVIRGAAAPKAAAPFRTNCPGLFRDRSRAILKWPLTPKQRGGPRSTLCRALLPFWLKGILMPWHQFVSPPTTLGRPQAAHVESIIATFPNAYMFTYVSICEECYVSSLTPTPSVKPEGLYDPSASRGHPAGDPSIQPSQSRRLGAACLPRRHAFDWPNHL